MDSKYLACNLNVQLNFSIFHISTMETIDWLCQKSVSKARKKLNESLFTRGGCLFVTEESSNSAFIGGLTPISFDQ